MDTEIYYFSGTGNSLHVAKELQKRIPDTKIIPIVSLLNKEVIETKSGSVGFIFPIHLAMSPAPVRKFLEKIDLKSTEYIFAVVTRAGSQHRAFIDLGKILKKKGKILDSCFTLNMASNDPKFEDWHAATEEEIADLESSVQNNLDVIQNIVINKEKSREKDANFTVPMPAFSILSLILPFLNRFYNVEFYADSKCERCGTCEKVCLSGKVKMVDGKPVWQKDVQCFSCHACLNYCPEHAVQIRSTKLLKSFTDKNGRYSHPYATKEDIVKQK
ncbi:MAG TPA: EFR1 family ferrodoxin [Methanobacteriaceae archaeon]|nr:EFR1 family ferrodoxin [Methanobacteriaceae archaeon]